MDAPSPPTPAQLEFDECCRHVLHLDPYGVEELQHFDFLALPVLSTVAKAVCLVLGRAPEQAEDWGHCFKGLVAAGGPVAFQESLAAIDPSTVSEATAASVRALIDTPAFAPLRVASLSHSRAAGVCTEWALGVAHFRQAEAAASAAADPALRARSAQAAGEAAGQRVRQLGLQELEELAHLDWSAASILHGEEYGVRQAPALLAMSQAVCALLQLGTPERPDDSPHLLKAALLHPAALALSVAALDACALPPPAVAAAQAALALPTYSVVQATRSHRAAGVLAQWAAAASQCHSAAAHPEVPAEEAASLRAATAAGARLGAQAVLAAVAARAEELAGELGEGDALPVHASKEALQLARQAALHEDLTHNLRELASYTNIRPPLMKVGQALCTLLHVKPAVHTAPNHTVVNDYWTPLKPYFHDPKLCEKHLAELDPSKVTPQVHAKLKALANDPDLLPPPEAPATEATEGKPAEAPKSKKPALSAVEKISPIAGLLARWVRAFEAAIPPGTVWATHRPSVLAAIEQLHSDRELVQAKVAALG